MTDKIVKILKVLHVLVLGIVVATIVLLHLMPSPFLDFLRVPTFLKTADQYLGNVYPLSFYLYHGALYFFFLLMIVDFLSFTLEKSMRLKTISAAFSLMGIFVMGAVAGLFLYTLFQNSSNELIFKGALTYAILCSILFLIDLATFVTDEYMLLVYRKQFPFLKSR